VVMVQISMLQPDSHWPTSFVSSAGRQAARRKTLAVTTSEKYI